MGLVAGSCPVRKEVVFGVAVRGSRAGFPAPACSPAKGPYLDTWTKASGEQTADYAEVAVWQHRQGQLRPQRQGQLRLQSRKVQDEELIWTQTISRAISFVGARA